VAAPASPRTGRRGFGRGPRGGALAEWAAVELLDAGVLRHLWTNRAPVTPGVFRSNHPGPARLRRLKAQGLASVLSLRGRTDHWHFQREEALCAALGLEFRVVALGARVAPPAARLAEALAALRSLPRPLLVHCKSGADRTGLICGLWILDQTGDHRAARRQLSLQFLHISRSSTGIMDAVLDDALAAHARGQGLDAWLAQTYDPARVTAAFAGAR
jgi:protein tyrosine phosphatase (PTP) superfamily phosphohydrolase (DUF442 family)